MNSLSLKKGGVTAKTTCQMEINFSSSHNLLARKRLFCYNENECGAFQRANAAPHHRIIELLICVAFSGGDFHPPHHHRSTIYGEITNRVDGRPPA
jgi:hypothetical protein